MPFPEIPTRLGTRHGHQKFVKYCPNCKSDLRAVDAAPLRRLSPWAAPVAAELSSRGEFETRRRRTRLARGQSGAIPTA